MCTMLPRAAVAHGAGHGLGQHEGADQVDPEHLREVGRADVAERGAEADRRGIDEDVHAAELGPSRRHEAGHVRLQPTSPARPSRATGGGDGLRHVAAAAPAAAPNTATRAPSRAKQSAMARPMPVPPPATIATLPSSAHRPRPGSARRARALHRAGATAGRPRGAPGGAEVHQRLVVVVGLARRHERVRRGPRWPSARAAARRRRGPRKTRPSTRRTLVSTTAPSARRRSSARRPRCSARCRASRRRASSSSGRRPP